MQRGPGRRLISATATCGEALRLPSGRRDIERTEQEEVADAPHYPEVPLQVAPCCPVDPGVELLHIAAALSPDGWLVLQIGSEPFRFEEVADGLEGSSHEEFPDFDTNSRRDESALGHAQRPCATDPDSRRVENP